MSSAASLLKCSDSDSEAETTARSFPANDEDEDEERALGAEDTTYEHPAHRCEPYWHDCYVFDSLTVDPEDGMEEAQFNKARQALKRTREKDTRGIDGNIYRYLCFFAFGTVQSKKEMDYMLFNTPNSVLNCCMMHVGVLAVFLFQVFAPLAILITTLDDLVDSYNLGAWVDYDWNQWFVVILAWMLLFLFILSTYFKITRDSSTSRKLARLANGLTYLRQPVCLGMLIVDAIVNSYVACTLSVVMFFVVYDSATVLDVLLDALGLAFLNSIDDIASEFGFLGGVWDDDRVGLLYDSLEEEGVFRDIGDPDPDDRRRDVYQSNSMWEVASSLSVANAGWKLYVDGPWYIYTFARCWLVLCLILAIPSPFFLASNATPGVTENQQQAINRAT